VCWSAERVKSFIFSFFFIKINAKAEEKKFPSLFIGFRVLLAAYNFALCFMCGSVASGRKRSIKMAFVITRIAAISVCARRVKVF
jgi:hypothetical protein